MRFWASSAVPVKTRSKRLNRAKCKRWHPDLNPNDPTAEEHFKEVQAAYDAITKGETGPQMGGGYGGGYGQQSGPSYGGYQQGYQQNGYSNGDFGDFGFGYDFGFGFGFGGNYQQQRGPGYNGADTPEMQAPATLSSTSATLRPAACWTASPCAPPGGTISPRWPIRAWATASMPCRMPAAPPDGAWQHRVPDEPAQSAGPGPHLPHPDHLRPAGGLMRWCWSMILLNLLCNCCCGGGWGWRFRM